LHGLVAKKYNCLSESENKPYFALGSLTAHKSSAGAPSKAEGKNVCALDTAQT